MSAIATLPIEPVAKKLSKHMVKASDFLHIAMRDLSSGLMSRSGPH